MTSKPGQVEFMRLRKLLLKDKVSTPDCLKGVIKSDIYTVLTNYMELNPDELEVEIAEGDGKFCLNITAYTKRFKQLGALPCEV